MLYLAVEVGIGGVLVVDGRPFVGAQGEGGEFGHMPFGSEGLRVPVWRLGCWDLEVDGRALARALGRRAPADPRAFAAHVIAAANFGAAVEKAAVATVARALGRGTGALVNALDPDLVVYGGLAPDLRGPRARPTTRPSTALSCATGETIHPRSSCSALGADASLLGAAESGFDLVLTASLLLIRDRRSPRAAVRLHPSPP